MDGRPPEPAALVDFHAIAPGALLPTVEFAIGAAETRAYLLATGSAADVDARIAPPLALVALALAAMTERMPLPPSAQHVGQEVTFEAPVRVGATVCARFTLEARRATGRQALSVFTFELYERDCRCAHGRLTLRHLAA